MKVSFYDLLISSSQTGGSAGSVNPTDQVSFNFGKIEHEDKEQLAAGGLGGTTKASLRPEEDARSLRGSPLLSYCSGGVPTAVGSDIKTGERLFLSLRERT